MSINSSFSNPSKALNEFNTTISNPKKKKNPTQYRKNKGKLPKQRVQAKIYPKIVMKRNVVLKKRPGWQSRNLNFNHSLISHLIFWISVLFYKSLVGRGQRSRTKRIFPSKTDALWVRFSFWNKRLFFRSTAFVFFDL